MPRPFPILALLAALAAAPASAQAPSPLDGDLFAFPGAVVSPGTAASAGVALADRWLGEEPFSNPAFVPHRGVVVSPLILRVSRQDLRAANRDYDEQAAAIDVAGGWLAVPIGPAAVAIYGYQPVFRSEDNAFTRGKDTPQAATIKSTSTERELHAGLALSWAVGSARVGVAGEWTRRDDAYDESETSGSPQSGTRHVDFSGDAFGLTAGARVALGGPGPGGVALGAGVRWLPELTLQGSQALDLLSGSTEGTIDATRSSTLEGGVSARVVVTPTFRVLGAVGGRGAQAWNGLGVSAGPGFEWRLGFDFHDPDTPWTARFGLGQEQTRGVPEPRAGDIGLGLRWDMDGTLLDFGVVRRTLERGDSPRSYDDRVLATVTVPF